MEQNILMKASEITEQTIRSCQQGNKDAFNQLFIAYKDRVYTLALHYTGNESSATDITQNVFLKIFLKIKEFRFDSGFQTWIYRIVVNECLEEQRRQKRLLPFIYEEMSRILIGESVEESFYRRQITENVQNIIATLIPKLRLPILLRYVEELSYDEIAEILGCSKGTVASRLNTAHKILAYKLAHLENACGEMQ
jgi:RNA polymerase sigma-70 factor, ECF subfamily